MIVLFGYMDFLIIFKWLTNWYPQNNQAPSVITTMINLPIKLGATVYIYLNKVRLLWRAAFLGNIYEY